MDEIRLAPSGRLTLLRNAQWQLVVPGVVISSSILSYPSTSNPHYHCRSSVTFAPVFQPQASRQSMTSGQLRFSLL